MRRHVLLVGILLTACTSAAQIEGERMNAQMSEHFTALEGVKASVIQGQLGEAQGRAGKMTASLRDQDYPASWAEHLADLRKGLFTIQRADDLQTASAGLARAGSACGDCHDKSGISLFEDPAAPSKDKPEDLSEYMWQHLAASQKMWAGLVEPSDDHWQAGSAQLANAGLYPQGREMDEEMRMLADSLHTIGSEASAAKSGKQRVEYMAKFLGTCAGCHARMRDEVVD